MGVAGRTLWPLLPAFLTHNKNRILGEIVRGELPPPPLGCDVLGLLKKHAGGKFSIEQNMLISHCHLFIILWFKLCLIFFIGLDESPTGI